MSDQHGLVILSVSPSRRNQGFRTNLLIQLRQQIDTWSNIVEADSKTTQRRNIKSNCDPKGEIRSLLGKEAAVVNSFWLSTL